MERAANLTYMDGSPATAADYYSDLAAMREELFGKNDPLTVRARARHAASLAANVSTSRNDLAAAATELTECVRVFRRLDAASASSPGAGPDSAATWMLEALEALELLYSPERLDYPRRLAEVKRQLEGLR